MSTLTLTSAAPDVGPHSSTKEEDLARHVDHGGVETVDDGQGDALTGVGSVVAEAGHLQCHVKPGQFLKDSTSHCSALQ